MPRIFVYGTLKSGSDNHHYLAGQHFIGPARTQPVYRLRDLGGYPGLVVVQQDGLSVYGEVWDVDAACLRHLDVLEDVAGGAYAREPIQLLAPYDQETVQGYRYLRRLTGHPDCGDKW